MLKLLKNSYFRTVLYVLLFVFFALLGNFSVENLKICPFDSFFSVICPGCGTTRAFINVMQLNFTEALHLNPLFTLFILPASSIIFLQDIIFAAMRLFGRKQLSFVDFILDFLFGEKND